MWLFSNNSEVRRKKIDKLVEVSTDNNVPVARLKCWYDTNKTQGGKQRSICKSHFDANCYRCETDVCVGARVALRNWNILPCAGLYNGSIGTVVEIVYRENPIGPNDKQHNHPKPIGIQNRGIRIKASNIRSRNGIIRFGNATEADHGSQTLG